MSNIRFRAVAMVAALFFSYCLSFGQDLQTAKSLTRSERFEDAETAYKSVLKKEPNNADAYFYYGESSIKQYLADTFSIAKSEVLKSATDLFKKGLAADTNNALNPVGLGIVDLLNNGDTTKADKWFNKANSKVPAKASKCVDKDVQVLISLGSAQIYGKNKRFNKALEYLGKAKEATTDKKTGLGKNAEVFLATGDVYLAKKNHNEAIKNYRSALSVNGKLVEAQLRIGYLYLGAKNLNEARAAFEEAKTVDSTFAPVYRGLGEVYTAANMYKFAKDNYRKFLQLSGDNVPAKVMYAGSLFKSQDYNETINVIEEVLAVDNSRNYLNRLGAYSYFERRTEKGVDKTPDYEKGLRFSETFFKNTIPERIIPKDFAYMGRLQLKLKKDSTMIDNGIGNLMKAYELDTADKDMQNEIIKACYYNKRYEKAANFLSKKIQGGNAEVSDYMMLGKTYYQMKEYGKADSVFTQVTSNDPANIDAYVWQANTAASMDPDSKAGLAKPKYEMIIQKASSDSVKYAKEIFDSYNYLASYYLFTKNDYAQSKTYVQKMISASGSNKDWSIKGYTFLGIIYTKTKEYARAKDAYQKLLSYDPSNENAKKAIEGINKVLESQKNK